MPHQDAYGDQALEDTAGIGDVVNVRRQVVVDNSHLLVCMQDQSPNPVLLIKSTLTRTGFLHRGDYCGEEVVTDGTSHREGGFVGDIHSIVDRHIEDLRILEDLHKESAEATGRIEVGKVKDCCDNRLCPERSRGVAHPHSLGSRGPCLLRDFVRGALTNRGDFGEDSCVKIGGEIFQTSNFFRDPSGRV